MIVYTARISDSQIRIPDSTYLKIENGMTPNPSIQNVLNIAEALGISLDELVGRKPTGSA
jgi:transcriptional regulator with XRE-family HTH domain